MLREKLRFYAEIKTLRSTKIFEYFWITSCESEHTEAQLTNVINKDKSHPSIKKIKSNYTIKQKFSFKPVTVKDTENVIKNIPTKKVSGGEMF